MKFFFNFICIVTNKPYIRNIKLKQIEIMVTEKQATHRIAIPKKGRSLYVISKKVKTFGIFIDWEPVSVAASLQEAETWIALDKAKVEKQKNIIFY